MEDKQQSQNKNRYTTLIHIAETINKTVKTIREAGMVSAADHTRVETITKEDNNNNEVQIRDNTINVRINMNPITYNHAQHFDQILFKMCQTRSFCKSL